MLPAGYPFSSIVGEGFSAGFPLTQVSLNNALFGSNPSNMSPAQLLQQAILQNALSVALNPMAPVVCSGTVPNTNQVGILTGPVQLTPLNPVNCVNPVMLYPSMGSIQVPLSGTGGPTSADIDAHTIVRGPVLYKKTPTTSEGDETQTGNKNSSKTNKETSPPDRIVASYAAAAHAAALANHHPVSKAAEVFLAATTTGRTRHPKRSRVHSSAVSHSDLTAKRAAVGASNSAYSAIQSLSGTSTTSGEQTTDNGFTEWRRIVDRLSGKVVYIAPDGISLNNMGEVYAYFRTRFPSFADGKDYEQLMNSSFVFEPTTDAPSLETNLGFITSLQSTATCCSATTMQSNTITTAPANTSAIQSSSPPDDGAKSSNASLCRIAFNPSRFRNPNANLFGRLSSSDSTSDLVPPTTSMTTASPPSKSAETDGSKVVSTAGNSTSSTLPLEASGDSFKVSPNASQCLSDNTELTKTDQPVTLGADLIANCVPSSENLSTPDSSAAIVSRITDSNGTGDNSVVNTHADSFGLNTTASTPVSEVPATLSGFTVQVTSNPNHTPSTAAENTVARMTTETLTTGILNTAIPSCNSTLVTSVVPPTSTNDLSLLALTGLVSEPSVMHSIVGSGDSTNHDLALSSLLATSRFAQVQQQQQQQQQLNALLSALSAASASAQSYSTPTLMGGNAQLSPLVLAAHPQCASWPQITSIPCSWSDLSNSTTLSVLQQQQQQQQHQQLIAAAALQQQQQQQRANYVAQAAALLQRQHALASQQQQQALASAGQVQAYLAALQRHFSIG